MKLPFSPRIAMPCLTAVFMALSASAGNTDTSYRVRAGVGYDSNPLLVTRLGSPGGGVFSQIRLSGGVSGHPSPSLSLFASGFAGARFDESSTSDAGHQSGGARAGLILTPRFAGQRMAVSFGARYSIYRETFTDSATGAVYEANTDPAFLPSSTIPIPERLNRDAAGVFFKVRWRQNRRFKFSLDSMYDQTKYVEDYAEQTALSPLDYRSLRVRPGVSFRFNDIVSLGLSVSWTDLEYDERLALDELGNAVVGTTRAYRYVGYDLALRVRPAERWSLRVGLGSLGRDDVHAGYYDYTGLSTFLAVDHEFGPRSRLHLYVSAYDTDYDTATVPGDPTDNLLGSTDQIYLARFDRSFGRRTGWFVEGGTRQRENQDPDFSYDRDWLLVGIHFGR
jgi:hypothetical protein